MPAIDFGSITDPLLRLPAVIQSIPDVLRNPAANPVPAAVLLAIALNLVLIVLISVILLIMRRSERDYLLDRGEYGLEDDEYFEDGEYLEDDEYFEDGEYRPTEETAENGGGAEAGESKHPLGWLTVSSIIILVFVGVWVVAGITTSSSDVCISCHSDVVHAAARAEDPHSKVLCVSCHEPGGAVARVTVNLATRAQHFVRARLNSSFALAYGMPVGSDGCSSCHRKQISGTFFDRTLGVRVSHKEPIAAGAQCVECHVLASGAVTARTLGMAPCLRCHDGKLAKAECAECHVGNPSSAIRAANTGSMAALQIVNARCTGCHVDMTKCNACHGISMPHSAEFKLYGHARYAAIEIWRNNGKKSCDKCHYRGHNDCMQPGCHLAPFPGHPSLVWGRMHGQARWSKALETCRCHPWYPWDHDGKIFCQICHPQRPGNAKP